MKNKKGSIFIITLFVILVFITILGFAYDISRIMYYKSYTKNLASVMALSIVNECGHVYHDKNNGARVVIIHKPQIKPKDYKGKYYANKEFIKVLYDKNKKGMDEHYHVDPNSDILINPTYINNERMLKITDTDRFEVGADGINGEVEIHITARIDLYFLRIPFKNQIIIHESAIAQPTATVMASYEQLREEQEILFDYIDW